MTTSSLIPLSEATDFLPRRRGKKVHVKTLIRWIKNGCRGVKLCAVKNGDIWCTSQEWLLKFQSECSSRGAKGSTGVTAATGQLARRILEQRYGFHAKEKTGTGKDKKGQAKGEVPGLRSGQNDRSPQAVLDVSSHRLSID